ncbi:MAG TPA: hypothetical protein DGT21_02105 [Armatimonadetes bacterium]|nr:hypothetical protein [Armatimonadota bacterium]
MKTKQETIEIEGRRVPYSVCISKRARRTRLQVTPVDGLVVTIPYGCDPAGVPEMLRSKAAWVLEHIEQITTPTAPAIRDGGTVLFRGEEIPVHVTHLGAEAEASTVSYRNNEVFIGLHPSHRDMAGHVFEQWIRANARNLIRREIASLDPERRFPYDRLYIRNQQTKWGSCSSRRNLSFNCRLVMAPPFVLRYIVAHELAHLKELNHSRSFWELVESLYGDYSEPERWLKENGALLAWR